MEKGKFECITARREKVTRSFLQQYGRGRAKQERERERKKQTATCCPQITN
jgi:hypothetical protein